MRLRELERTYGRVERQIMHKRQRRMDGFRAALFDPALDSERTQERAERVREAFAILAEQVTVARSMDRAISQLKSELWLGDIEWPWPTFRSFFRQGMS